MNKSLKIQQDMLRFRNLPWELEHIGLAVQRAGNNQLGTFP